MENIRRFPASSFGVSLGTAGQASLWNFLNQANSSDVWPLSTLAGAPSEVNEIFWLLALLLLSLTSFLYVLKAVRDFGSVLSEFRSSVNVNFFYMPFLVVMVLGNSAPKHWFSGSVMPLFYATVLPLLALEVYLYTEWMYGVTRSLAWANPAYQLAIVGNIIAAQLAVKAEQRPMAVFLFAVGLFYWLLTVFALHTVRDEVAWLQRGGGNNSAKLLGSAKAGEHSSDGFHGSSGSLDTHTGSSAEPSTVSIQVQSESERSPVVPSRGNHLEASSETSDSGQLLISPLHAEDSTEHRHSAREDGGGVSSSAFFDIIGLSAVETQHLNTWSRRTPLWSLPKQLQPTLFLYVAPPSLASISWHFMEGHCTMLGQGLASIGFFFFLVNIAHLPRYLFHTPFSFGVWAFTFPSAALAVSSVAFSNCYSSTFVSGLSFALVCISIFLFATACCMTIVFSYNHGIEVLLLPKSNSNFSEFELRCFAFAPARN